jgi:uncharacterized membrane protein YjgN (DUF898 family)
VVIGFDFLTPDIPAPATPGVKRLLPQVPAVAGLLVLGGLVATVLCIVRLEFNYKSLLVTKAYIGAQAGRWKPAYRDFVRIWAATLGIFLGGALLLAVLAAVAVGGTLSGLSSGKPLGVAAIFAIVAGVFAFIFGLFLISAPARAYREARMFQLVWNNVGVSTIARFKCKLKAKRYVMLRVRNIFLTLLTLGFFRPFAMVSEYRMKTESVTLHVKGGLDQLVGQLVRQQEGLGDALADAVGLDLVG